MSTPVEVITSATQEATSASPIPRVLWGIFRGINKVHNVWYWYRKFRLYKNPDNWLKLAGGHALNFFTNSTILKLAAQSLLIATRIDACIYQARSVARGWHKWTEAIRGRYLIRNKCAWYQNTGNGFLSPSTRHFLKRHFQYRIAQIKRIFWLVLSLLKRLFKLSMYTLDAVEAIRFSPRSKRDAVNEIFVNSFKWMDKLVENKQELKYWLEEKEEVIDRLLRAVYSPFKARHLIKVVSKSIDITCGVYNPIRRIDRFSGGFFKACAKRSVFGFLAAFNLAHLTPSSWVPPRRPPWEEEEIDPDDRFPKVKWVPIRGRARGASSSSSRHKITYDPKHLVPVSPYTPRHVFTLGEIFCSKSIGRSATLAL